jgi:outer membrane murein-binding lipoprotein Lpp
MRTNHRCWMLVAAFALLATLMLGGCVSAERVDALFAQAARAEEVVARIEIGMDQTAKAVEVARALAEATGSAEAIKAVEVGERTLVELREHLPVARATAADLATAAKAAQAQREAGGNWLDMGLAVALALLTGAGGAGAVAGRVLGKWKTLAVTGIKLAQALKPAAEQADPEGAAAAIKEAKVIQVSNGVQAKADLIRYGG